MKIPNDDVERQYMQYQDWETDADEDLPESYWDTDPDDAELSPDKDVLKAERHRSKVLRQRRELSHAGA